MRDDALPSPEGIRELVETFQRDSGVTATYDETGEPQSLAAGARVALFRAAQEALTNVAKHADATRVNVQLAWRAEAVVLRVSDDGRGAAATSRGGGNGLRGMRERAELAGGEVIAGPGGDGFKVEVRLPVNASAPRPTAAAT